MSQLELAKARARIAEERRKAAQPQRTLGQSIYENVVGSGEIDTPGERFGATLNDMGRSLGSGIVRGATALADLPGQAFNAVGGTIATGMERAGVVSPQVAQQARESIAFGPMGSGETVGRGVDTAMPKARSFQPQTTAGEYAQTVGEFLPGGVLAKAPMMAGVVPGLASEAAGQATEGTAIEPYARVIASVAAPLAADIGTKAFRSLFTASQKRPDIPILRAAKTQAYRDVDEAGEVFAPEEVERLLGRVRSALDDGNYVPGVDKQTDAVVSLLEKKASQPLKLGQLDKIRQSFFKRYEAAKNETGILDAIDAIDDMIASRPDTSGLMKAARLANSRYKKAELLDLAFEKAADQTAGVGSGGNILNKYRQAVTNIINNPKQAKWFAPEEIEAMRSFVRGSFGENALRRVGKLSPGGNGLMLALNLGAVAVEPAMLTATAIAAGSKVAADRMATKGAQRLMDVVSGYTPAAQPPRNIGPTLAPLGSAILNQ